MASLRFLMQDPGLITKFYIMKVRKRLMWVLIILAFTSCDYVYSLFPMYTKETLINVPNLEGKWKAENTKDYITFQKKDALDDSEKLRKPKKGQFVDSLTSENYVLYFKKEVKVKIDDEIIRDKKVIKRRLDALFPMIMEEEEQENLPEIDFDGDALLFEKGAYKIRVHTKGKDEYYSVHMAQVDDKIFMDVEPLNECNSNSFSDNFLPVHTFFKIDLTGNRLDIASFDVDKLSELFESNRIRLRHEKVNDKIVITAKPKEIQAFYAEYSKRASAFNEPKRYIKAGS